MEIKKSKIKKIIIPIIIIVVSIILEMILSNYKIVTLNNSEKGNHIIDTDNFSTKEKIVDDKALLNIEIKNMDVYVKKLSIEYDAKVNTTVSLKYKLYNEYNDIISVDTKETILKDLDEITINLNKKIDSISIQDINIEDVNITGMSYCNDFTFSIYRCLFFVVALILCCAIYLYRNQSVEQLHKIAFLVIFLIGTIIIVASPRIANQNFDEQVHIYKTYTNSYLDTAYYSDAYYYVSESPGINLPKSIESNNKLNDVLNSKEMSNEISTRKSKFVPYNEIPYLIMSAGIRIGNTFNMPFTVVFCLGKMMNLLIYALLTSYAVKKAVSGKKIIFVLALMPTAIYSASHFSLDAIVNGGILLSIVMFLSMYKEKDKKLNVKDLSLFSFPLILACLAKAIYAPIMLLLLLLPKSKFKDANQSRMFKLAVTFMFIMMMGSFLLPMLAGGVAGDARGGNTSVSGQLSTILHNPIGFIEVFYNNIHSTISNYIFSHRMYANFAYIPSPAEIYTMFYIIIMLYTGFVSGKEFTNIKTKERVFILIGTIAIMCMIYGSMYLSFTEVGSTVIQGVQARYFIPLLLPLMIVFVPRNKISFINENRQITVINYIVLAILLASLYGCIISVFCL